MVWLKVKDHRTGSMYRSNASRDYCNRLLQAYTNASIAAGYNVDITLNTLTVSTMVDGKAILSLEVTP
jgi:hypothetical protein